MKRKHFLRNSIVTIGLFALQGKKLFGNFFHDLNVIKRRGDSRARQSANNIVKVNSIWLGALTPFSIKANAKIGNSGSSQARLIVSTSAALTDPMYGPYAPANAGNNYMAAMSVNGLVPATRYWYAVDSDTIPGDGTGPVGSFITPSNARVSFSFTVSADNLDSNHAVYTQMQAKTPMFHITTGDFHYADPNSATDINVHRAPYEGIVLRDAKLKTFLLNTPLAYMWDDHDYCGNDSNAASAGKTNARLSYQEYVPHYPLAAGSGDQPIYQAFTIGRVRFIMSDLRSARQFPTIMGAVQKAWFKNECLAAKNNDQVIAWISSVSFGGDHSDNWGGYADERSELCDFFRDNHIRNMFIICGDAHMVAIDNGNNHDFSSGKNNPNHYPVFQAAALNQNGSFKGGVYSEGGPYINPDTTFGQYGLVDVIDDGGFSVQIVMRGYRVAADGTETLLVTHTYVPSGAGGALAVKISSFDVKASSNNNFAELEWTVQDESSCAQYVIERSANGGDFGLIHVTNCSGGANAAKYAFTDLQPLPGMNYYRLKVIEPGSNFIYSAIRSVRILNDLAIRISSSPVTNILHVVVKTSKKITAGYRIYNMRGEIVSKRQGLFLNPGEVSLDADVGFLGAGLYIFALTWQGRETRARFVKG